MRYPESAAVQGRPNMDTAETLKAARLEASEAAARIEARIKDKLLKRARKHGITDEREVTELVHAWKQAARHTKHVRLRPKGH
jgi:hypothetical protein